MVLKGVLTAPSAKKLAINSDAIDLTKEAYGSEAELRAIVDNVSREAAKYLFDGKMIKQEKLDFGTTEDPDKTDNEDDKQYADKEPEEKKEKLISIIRSEEQEKAEKEHPIEDQNPTLTIQGEYADQEPPEQGVGNQEEKTDDDL